MAEITTLYPPIVDTYMPAFLIKSEDEEKNICKVYFSLSSFNSLSQIVNAQVSVRSQYTNLSVLNKDYYPSEIKLTQIKVDESIDGDNKYYIEIYPSDIIDGNFEYDLYYKVQIRFTGIEATAQSLNIPQSLDSWLANNLQFFSEWSTVTLVRGISEPSLELNCVEDGDIIWDYSSIVSFIGKLKFNYFAEKDYLKSYNIKLTNDALEVIEDSGIIYPMNTQINEINYTSKYNLEQGEQYYAIIKYTTQALYTETIVYPLMVLEPIGDKIDATISALIDKENGRIGIYLKGTNPNNKISIRRSSSKDNFNVWEEINIFEIKGSDLSFLYYDNTIESGVWYKYGVQKIDAASSAKGKMLEMKDPVMIELEYDFLTIGDKQLKLSFNSKLSSITRVLGDSKVDTIGSKYPFITRNGSMNYAQFPINGLITALSDGEGLFATKKDIYGENEILYENYNNKYNINSYSDNIFEKEFRKKVLDFLYNDEPRLFRSAKDGNYIVRLMDVSYSPNNQLDNLIGNFSCTAYEICDNTIENYKKLSILNQKGENGIEIKNIADDSESVMNGQYDNSIKDSLKRD